MSDSSSKCEAVGGKVSEEKEYHIHTFGPMLTQKEVRIQEGDYMLCNQSIYGGKIFFTGKFIRVRIEHQNVLLWDDHAFRAVNVKGKWIREESDLECDLRKEYDGLFEVSYTCTKGRHVPGRRVLLTDPTKHVSPELCTVSIRPMDGNYENILIGLCHHVSKHGNIDVEG